MELEDRYGIRVSEEEAAEIKTVGDAVDFVCARAPAGLGREPRADDSRTASLAELFADTPEELRRQALSHSSWVERRTEAYGRLAFLGDSVLGLAVASELFRRLADADIGELTRIHNQAVSGRACAEVASGHGFPELLREQRPRATAWASPSRRWSPPSARSPRSARR